jgi:hypothetical protein
MCLSVTLVVIGRSRPMGSEGASADAYSHILGIKGSQVQIL